MYVKCIPHFCIVKVGFTGVYLFQGYCWLENVRGHFTENTQLETLSPIFLHYKTGPLFQNEGAILKINGQFCPWPLPKLSLLFY